MEVKDCKVQLQGTIYIDSIFLLNLVMDLYLLTLTARILGKTATYPRIFAGSAVGAAGYCTALC
ncbi:MAG: sigma-E processing peptidase SpoIIGA, partial [Lachnospiraceae bacterium]|nr:sigma-E processing peptidase SpoIIGA [Lachnospiraceae bacterium]